MCYYRHKSDWGVLIALIMGSNMIDNNIFIIYANGRKAKYFNIGLPLLAVFCIVIAVAGFITNNIVIGIIMVAVLILLLLLVPKFMSTKNVKFCEDHLEIPLEYVMQGVPFSKTFIRYDGLVSVSYIDKVDVDDDCTGSNGRKVPCIKFVDKKGEVYRLKIEYFSKSQAEIIIEETKRRAGLEMNEYVTDDIQQ